jgi:hypothetical protein
MLAACIMLVSYLARLFDPEDVGDVFFRKVGISPNYITLQRNRSFKYITGAGNVARMG